MRKVSPPERKALPCRRHATPRAEAAGPTTAAGQGGRRDSRTACFPRNRRDPPNLPHAAKIAPREIEVVIGSLPVGPTILGRLHAMLRRDRSSTIDIVLAVRMDPALATAVIHVARSALYGSPPPALGHR